MVMVIHHCHCENCPGNSSPAHKPGEMVFGGAICNCSCHTLKGEALIEHLKTTLMLLRAEKERYREELHKVKYK